MKFSGTTILVSGGSGFMGSHFVRLLHNNYPSYRVVNLDLLTYAGNPDNLKDLEGSPRYEFVHGDICDAQLIEKLFKLHDFSAVVNFAAESHVDRSIINSMHFVRTNIQGVHTLLEAVRAHKVGRFIQISTDEIYGDVEKGFSAEDSPIKPSNPYSASKASADLLVQAYMRTHKVPALIVRGSNNFGPNQYPEKLIPLAISSLLEGGKIPVHGAGNQVRTWIHVEDFCRAVDLILHQADVYKIYNISGEQKTNLEVISLVADLLGKNIHDHIKQIDDRPGADARYAPDSSRLKKELGWKFQYAFTEGLSATVRWYTENQAWWKKIKESDMFQHHYEKQSKAQYY